ncbi:RtcB family protein [Luteolibacter pohnpeiensis]|uniref:3'-phosphate/5'-hydroxy nucleic acid ligase n=1 Tax=Luteolibacter pohnpeiensis TaxID=454153 RepID=A0A934S9T0_9BACT|nr:RtcB family protein [Luteolibacter pohnpeiensis]MBK1882267.1 RtcB family protein [Luteolibacter pohnpeiensis]
MNPISKKQLLEAGYHEGPLLEQILQHLVELDQKGITDSKYALKLIRRKFGEPPPKLVLREKPVECAEAIEANGRDEQENLYAVRRHMQELLKTPVISKGVILPDACPMGGKSASIPVGGAIAVENAIIPAAHSSDICCSMFATFYEARSSVSSEMDALMSSTRFGTGHRHLDLLVDDPVHDEDVWSNPFLTGLRDRAKLHMADQGDGNHFAFLGEIEVTEEMLAVLRLTGHHSVTAGLTAGKIYRVLVTHHGSRGLGAHVFKRGQIAAMKHTAKLLDRFPENAAWLDARSGDGPAYWEALQYVAMWTKANHRSIHRRFLERIGASGVAEIANEHNFVWQRGDTFFHGKGATPAWRDADGKPLLGLIPLNMAEPILVVLGADNPDFLSFAPHGAGRNISRAALRRRFPGELAKSEEIARATAGLDVRWYCGKPDLSETPVAYKNAQQVKSQIAKFNLAEVVGEIRPLGCIMAGDSGKSWRDREEELSPKQIRQIQHRADRRKNHQRMSSEFPDI